MSKSTRSWTPRHGPALSLGGATGLVADAGVAQQGRGVTHRSGDVEARLNPWLLALVLPIAGFVFGVYVGAAIRLGGAPGAILSRQLTRDSSHPVRFAAGVAAISLGQLLVSFLWIASLYLSVTHLLADRDGVGRYVAWALTLGAAAMPAQTALSIYALSEAEQVAGKITLRVTTVAAVVLLFLPSPLERVLGWLPTLR
jgi:hypothetical protein